MSAPQKIFLDARELEHPIPLEKAMQALRELEGSRYFYMIHRKNPIPLIDMANEQGLAVFNKEDESHTWHILISKDNTLNLEQLCDV